MEFDFYAMYEANQWIDQKEIERRKGILEENIKKLTENSCNKPTSNSLIRVFVLYYFNLD